MSNALGDRCSTKILTAEQLGSVNSPINTAYLTNIIPHPSLATPNLQNVTTQGNTTSTDINMTNGTLTVDVGDVVATLGKVSAGGDLESGADIRAGALGDVVTNGGDVRSNSGNIRTNSGDLKSTSGNLDLTTGDIKMSSGSIDVTAGNIEATNGSITAGTDISSTAGNIFTNGTGSISILGTGHISSTSGDIFTNSGDVIATAGDIKALGGGVEAAAGHSKFNRMQYTTAYGGSTFAAPVTLLASAPFNSFILPNGTYQLVLYAYGTPTSTSFGLEIFTSYANVLRDYTLTVDFQTVDNNAGNALGLNNHLFGPADSAPLDDTKCAILINSTIPYSAGQIVKITVKFEYSPSP